MVVRVGFIGVGGVAQVHLRALEAIDGARIVAVSDASAEAAQATARRYEGCRAFDDHRTMLDEGELEAVYVCLPPGAHTGQEIDVAERGLPLFVEKPVGLDQALARRTGDVLARQAILSSVGYNWRYLDVTDAARAELSGRPVGLAVGYWVSGLPGTAWWRAREQSGGQVVEQTTHIFDLCRYLVGEVRQVFAGASRGQFADVPGYNIDDASAATLIFQSGAVGMVASSDLAPRGYQNVGLHLFSRDLVLEIGSTRLRIVRAGRVEEVQSATSAYQQEDRAFVQAVATGDRSAIRCDYADATRTLELTLAVNRSIETGQPVALAEE
ncbi:MAG TPA: Gfo/Idh/MocA family oxidoreductase [Chloroflexota bacterium]|nr:Gfo/Idh/MocA family oxidoreductase [Chloroflexota bacterium]